MTPLTVEIGKQNMCGLLGKKCKLFVKFKGEV